jgi:predicted RNase H-like nuclease (RuvC/YqgF family)
MSVYRYFIFASCLAVITISGCGETQTPSGKQSRLIAAENMDMKKQIGQLEEQIEKLKEQQQKELEEQQKLLDEARKEIESWKQQSEETIRKQVQGVLDTVIQENSDLRKEIEKLNGWLEMQRTQITELEKMLKDKQKK